ncbi:MAG: hypothetical protein ACM3JG_06875 [Thiohalocapsa sp.]
MPPSFRADAAPLVDVYYSAATCTQPAVKDLTMVVNNGWRMEDVWLDK